MLTLVDKLPPANGRHFSPFLLALVYKGKRSYTDATLFPYTFRRDTHDISGKINGIAKAARMVAGIPWHLNRCFQTNCFKMGTGKYDAGIG